MKEKYDCPSVEIIKDIILYLESDTNYMEFEALSNKNIWDL